MSTAHRKLTLCRTCVQQAASNDCVTACKRQSSDCARCDVFIIVSEADQDSASKLADILVRFCHLFCGYRLTVFHELELGEAMLDHLRNGLKYSTYRLIFIGDGFKENDLVKFGTDAALMEMIHRQDQSIIPVRAHAGIQIPSLLRMFRPLDIHRLLRGKCLQDVDAKLLSESEIEKPLLEAFVKMLHKSASGAAMRPSASEPSLAAMSQHSELLRRHFSYLGNNLDPDSGLLAVLYSADVLGAREMENVRAEKTPFDRNECLVKMIMRKSEVDFKKFIAALREVGQWHIAEQLEPSAKRTSDR